MGSVDSGIHEEADGVLEEGQAAGCVSGSLSVESVAVADEEGSELPPSRDQLPISPARSDRDPPALVGLSYHFNSHLFFQRLHRRSSLHRHNVLSRSRTSRRIRSGPQTLRSHA